MFAAYCVNWTEYERGWGCRPDGHTLHPTLEQAKAFIDKHWDSQPDAVPDEYSSPDKPFLVEIDEATDKLIKEKGFVWGHPRNHRD